MNLQKKSVDVDRWMWSFQQMDAPAGTQISLEPTGKMAEDRTVLVTVTVEEVEAKVVTVNVLRKLRPCVHKMVNYVHLLNYAPCRISISTNENLTRKK